MTKLGRRDFMKRAGTLATMAMLPDGLRAAETGVNDPALSSFLPTTCRRIVSGRLGLMSSGRRAPTGFSNRGSSSATDTRRDPTWAPRACRPAWPIGVLLVAATCAGAEPVVHENVTYLPTNRVEQLTIAVPEGPGPFPCVMVVPGGGWGELAGHHQRTAVWLAENGFVGVVVEYHVPGGLGKDKSYERPSPLAGQPAIPQALYDLQAAIRFVRANAGTYRVDPARIGAVGFSAGGWSLSEVGYAKPGYTYANDKNPDHPWRYDDKNQPYADQSCDMKALVLSSGHSHVKQIIRDPDRTRPVPTMILCAQAEHREDNLKELETVFQSAGVEFLHGTSPQAKHAPDITPGKRGANAVVFKMNNGRQGPACVLVFDFLRRHLGAPTP